MAGRIARPLSSIYDSTKHALEAITDGLRGELAPFGIDVVLIRPGFILTEFVDAANQASEPVMRERRPLRAVFRGLPRRLPAAAQHGPASPTTLRGWSRRRSRRDRPAPRYAAPAHAKLFLFLKWLLPARVIDWMVRLRK